MPVIELLVEVHQLHGHLLHGLLCVLFLVIGNDCLAVSSSEGCLHLGDEGLLFEADTDLTRKFILQDSEHCSTGFCAERGGLGTFMLLRVLQEGC